MLKYIHRHSLITLKMRIIYVCLPSKITKILINKTNILYFVVVLEKNAIPDATGFTLRDIRFIEVIFF